MSVSLENNPSLIAAARALATCMESRGEIIVPCELRRLADALEHTHEIATAGWLDTEEQKL